MKETYGPPRVPVSRQSVRSAPPRTTQSLLLLLVLRLETRLYRLLGMLLLLLVVPLSIWVPTVTAVPESSKPPMYRHRRQLTTPRFPNCNVSEYYQNLPSSIQDHPAAWTRTLVTQLLSTTQQRILPYTDSTLEDVWDALQDLDAGPLVANVTDNTNNTVISSGVQLIYSNRTIPVFPRGIPSTWNREHLWPASLGVRDYPRNNNPLRVDDYPYTDVFHLRPADWNVNSARSNKYYGNCGCCQLATDVGFCQSPATEEAAADTATNNHVWTPPENRRGEIARSLLFLQLRYPELVLTDCPVTDTDMAYRSQLLQWHLQYPVSDHERRRNDRICQYWQGNRNILIDYPSQDVAVALFGEPQEPLASGVYNCSSGDPNPPSPVPDNNNTDSNPCGTLEPGDVMVVAMSSDDPDAIVMVALEALPQGLILYVTDNAWTGSAFATNEGVIRLRVTETIEKGAVFGLGPKFGDTDLLYGNDWETVSGNFALSASGDNVMLYCLLDGEDENDPSRIHHLSAFSYAGEWKEEDLPSYDTGTSALPDAIPSFGETALFHMDNYVYAGPDTGSKYDIQVRISRSSSWQGSNSASHNLNPIRRFNVDGTFTSNASDLSPANGLLITLLGFSAVVMSVW